MNEHVMESLLLDQALNALSPETEQLLQAYLSDHPEFQSLSDSIHQTAALGQKAVAAELPAAIPPFPRERWAHQPRHVSWLSRYAWKAMAACVLMGMGIGFSLTQLQHLDRQSSDAAPGLAHVTPESVSGGRQAAHTLWSMETYENRYKTYPARTKSKIDPSIIKTYGRRGLL